MNKLLSKLLGRRGIETIEELDPEEREQYKRWEAVLSKNQELTTKDIEKFCLKEIDKIEEKWTNEADGSLIPYHTVYKSIVKTINSPQPERETLEKYLNNLIKE